jgi:hypothetical protein
MADFFAGTTFVFVWAMCVATPSFAVESIAELTTVRNGVDSTAVLCTVGVEDSLVEVFSEVMIEEGSVLSSSNYFSHGLIEDDNA